MNRWFRRSLLPALIALTFIFIASKANAYEKGQYRFSGVIGQVGLLGDPGDGGANAFGFGVGAAFQLEENLAFDLRYMGSNHSNASHTDISVGAEYYFGDYTNAYPHAEAGMSFLSNDIKNADISGDAVGIYIGGGLSFELARNLMIGPEVRFVKGFESKSNVNGVDITTVDDSYSILLRVQYLLAND